MKDFLRVMKGYEKKAAFGSTVSDLILNQTDYMGINEFHDLMIYDTHLKYIIRNILIFFMQHIR